MLYRLLIAAILVAIAQTYSTGAGSCKATNPLGSPHTLAGTSGALSAYGLQLKIGGKVLTPGTAFSITSGSKLSISVGTTNGKTFKGFLMRMGKPSQTSLNTSGWLTVGTDSNVQVSNQCTLINKGGLTHKSNSAKTLVTGVLAIPKAVSSLKLEVTVVVQNSSGKSIWYKSDYTLNVK